MKEDKGEKKWGNCNSIIYKIYLKIKNVFFSRAKKFISNRIVNHFKWRKVSESFI